MQFCLHQYFFSFTDFSVIPPHLTVTAHLCVNDKTSVNQKSLKLRPTSVIFLLPCAAPSLISELRAEKIEQKSITLVWREPSYPNSSRTGYEVKYFEKVKSSFHHAAVVDPALPSFIWFYSPKSFLRILQIMQQSNKIKFFNTDAKFISLPEQIDYCNQPQGAVKVFAFPFVAFS